MISVKTPNCVVCGNFSIVEMTEEQMAMLSSYNRPFIQDIFADWSMDKRELLITGTHPECWNKLFPPEEDEPDIDWDGGPVDGTEVWL